MHPFLRNLQHQAAENPAGTIAAGALVIGMLTKTAAAIVDANNSRIWAKEVKRRAMKDALR